jgi:hypothetical protein
VVVTADWNVPQPAALAAIKRVMATVAKRRVDSM